MMKREIEFREEMGVIMMWVERDKAPFDEYMMGHFAKDNEDFYRFEPYGGVKMHCKHLREAAQKASDLNSTE